MCRYSKVFSALSLLLFFVTLTNGEEFVNNRDKRTIDLILRGFAHFFGHHVQKHPAAKPPPVVLKPTPKPPPPAPPKEAPKKVTTPNLIEEIVKKSFRLNFNWDKNHAQPIIPIIPKQPSGPAPPMKAPENPPPQKMAMMPPKPAAPPKMVLMSAAKPPPINMMPMLMTTTDKKPAEMEHRNEEHWYYFQPEQKLLKQEIVPENYETRYVQQGYSSFPDVDFSKLAESQPESTSKQHQDMGKLKHDFEHNFQNFAEFDVKNIQAPATEHHEAQNYDKMYENFANFGHKSSAPLAPATDRHTELRGGENHAEFNMKMSSKPQAQVPEQYENQHYDKSFQDFLDSNSKSSPMAHQPTEQYHFDKHYEDFVDFSKKVEQLHPVTTEHYPVENDEAKSAVDTSSLTDFWKTSSLKNDNGYKFLIEENGGNAQNHPSRDFKIVVAETPTPSHFKTVYYFPQESADSAYKSSEGHVSGFGLKINSNMGPQVSAVKTVSRMKHKNVKKPIIQSEHGSFIPTKFDGDQTFIPTKLQRLQHEDTKMFSVPAPFDVEYDGSQLKSTVQKAMVQEQKKSSAEDESEEGSVRYYQPDSFDRDYTFTFPSSRQNTAEATGGPEMGVMQDDRDLSRNAKVGTKEYAKRIVTVHKNANTRMNAW